MSEPAVFIDQIINRKLAELGRKEFEAELTGSFAPGKSPAGPPHRSIRRPTPAGATWRRVPLPTARARWQLIDDLGFLWATVWREPTVAEYVYWSCYDEHGKLAEGRSTDAWRAIHRITSAMAEDPLWFKCVEVYDPRTGVVHERFTIAAFRDDCGESPPCGGCPGCQLAQAVYAGFETRTVSRPFTESGVG